MFKKRLFPVALVVLMPLFALVGVCGPKAVVPPNQFVVAQAPPQEPKKAPDTAPKAVDGGVVGEVKLVDRDQLRVSVGTKRLAIDKKMRVALERAMVVPDKFDWTKGRTIPLPMMGNDRYGCCYHITPLKLLIMFNALNLIKVEFPDGPQLNRYRQLSGGDNGLSDGQIFPEMKRGMVGPNGPHKFLDIAVVSSTDTKALDLCIYAFGPAMFTFAVPSSVMGGNLKDGAVWDTQRGNYVGGHAVPLSGKDENGRYQVETWAIQTRMTPQFMHNNDPECITTFSLEWFNAKGYAPNGLHYTTLAPLWTSLTGGQLPVSPFPPPDAPTPPPLPPPAPPAGSVEFSFADLTPDAQAKLKAVGVGSFSIQLGFSAPVVPPVADPYLLADYPAVLAMVKTGKKVYLSIGPVDAYVGSTTEYHCRVDSLGALATGVYLCYLGTDGKPMMQRVAEPAPVGLTVKPIRNSISGPIFPQASNACVGGNCPTTATPASSSWRPLQLFRRYLKEIP